MSLIQTLRDKALDEFRAANANRRDDQMYFNHIGRGSAFEEAADLLEEAENS